MSKLVLTDGKKVFTTSRIIAEGTGVAHTAVSQLVKKYETELNDVGTLQFKIVKYKTAGRDGELFELDEPQATLVITLMRNSVVVVKFKTALVKEFYRQRKIITQLANQRDNPNWQQSRSSGKDLFKQSRDTIAVFVEYAIAQGSKNAPRYYSNLAQMENRSLFFLEQKYKNLRDILDTGQLMLIGTADQIVDKALNDGMEQELHYKEIFELAKERIQDLAKIMGKSPVALLTKQ